MSKYLKAEIWDKGQKLFHKISDVTMHNTLYYESHLDEDTLKKTLIFLITNIPVLDRLLKIIFSKHIGK